jgi:DNA ligase 1
VGSEAGAECGIERARHTHRRVDCVAMRFADLVQTADAVAETAARRGKVAMLAGLLSRLEPHEIEIGAGYLAGEPRQGKVGVGWRTLQGVDAVPSPESTLEIRDVHERLSALASLTGAGSRQSRHDALDDLFERADAAEGRFLRALLLGDLRQGAAAGVLAQAIAEAWRVDEDLVRRAAMLSGDLGAVAAAAAGGGEEALGAFRLQLFRPLQAMLAQTADSIDAALVGLRPAIVDWKLDGARVQVHRDGGEVRVYTRALRDVTATHGGVVEVVRALPVDRVVLDGEALALRPDGTPEAFQDSMRRGAALTPFFFDVLHLDGVDLLDAPLAERRAHLEQVVGARHRVRAAVVTTCEEARAFLAEALAHGHEGVMVKDPDSRYEAGRRGAAWRKVKPVHTLDLVVLAAEWGSGRRRGLLSNLHLGARDEGDGFVMLGKTFKGLTDELLAWQTRELLRRETGREGGVVHVRPELVVEVAFDGIQASPRYPGGVTLRFARVRRYRDDKAVTEADTIEAVRRLHG